MTINPNNDHLPESKAQVNLDKPFNNSPANSQAEVQSAIFRMITDLTRVFGILSSTRNLCNLEAIKAGFNSADETATGGKLLGAGGLILGTAGVVQGVGNFKQAEGIAKATQIRNKDLKILMKSLRLKILIKILH